MRKIRLAFVASILVFLTACSGPGESNAEFDGGYIWTSGDKYISLTEVKSSSTQIVKGRISFSALRRLPKYQYVLDSTPSAVLSSSDMQGIFIKGNYKFKDFTLHKLEERNISDKEGLFENKGSATKGKPFYFAGEKVAVDKKKDETASGYFFKVKESLLTGKYVGWIGSSFWILEIE